MRDTPRRCRSSVDAAFSAANWFECRIAQSGIGANGSMRGTVMIIKSVMLMALACAAAPMLAAMAYVVSAGL